ncbi:AraC family transcriptional regulator [Cohnella thermotolerans]|uniref:AraC family transcriptional regulator n=1 Tax=Cohnella thermotolerans TaxID=329858 RepID=UPI000422CAE1|nr:helix-turn-helix domain-containing protein [Cohnella thermotolerans]
MLKTFSRTSVHPHPRPGGALTVLFAGHSQTEPSHRMGPQKLDYVLIHTVIEGKGWFRCRDKHYDLGAGDSFVILPGELHSYQADERHPWRYRWISFRGSEGERWLAAAGVDAEHPIVHGGEETALKAMAAVEKAFRKKEWTSEWEAEGWLRLAFAAWAKANRPVGPPGGVGKQGIAQAEADRAARWLQAQSAHAVTIAQMAKELGYHRTHLTKLFRREMGMSPIRYLQQLRMERAKALLLEPLSVAEVALAVGYADPLYFSKSFKKHVGCTPSEFRSVHSTP